MSHALQVRTVAVQLCGSYVVIYIYLKLILTGYCCELTVSSTADIEFDTISLRADLPLEAGPASGT